MRLHFLVAWSCASLVQAQTPGPESILLPTDNHALFEGRPEDFYQFVDRTIDGKSVPVWEGGQFGFVRSPVKLNTGAMVYTRFHEGLDIKPVQRDARGEPLDKVRSMAAGEVVHASLQPGASNYGRYVVVLHDLGAEGPFVSLYAHLREITCTVGQKVGPGTRLGIMGYSGAGIDRRRAHTHVEMGLYLSSRFSVWHDHQTTTLNRHGIWNGLNIVGFDLGKFLQERATRPALTPAAFVKETPVHFRVAVPGDAEMELLQHYRWLCPVEVASKPRSWIMSFSAWGLPVKVEPSENAVDEPQVLWVQPSSTPQFSLTRGLLNGIGERIRLSSDGLSFIQLATGMFQAIPRAAVPVDVIPVPKKKRPATKQKAAR